ncbi:hypothetical protein [Caulobacter sp. NIBR1757]|uniref:hypothetical protein n=1 Tax=Caulobacter sp. NIBR1757 TaxID=3016000 RepID=UPI0022EFE8DF|nr:hypothetical protein [Caulobacter sp. NIBR1757]WGM37336.1 hypothetical protein AMEJIAPC_00233 [Caulobacter sp. NIBR1757]
MIVVPTWLYILFGVVAVAAYPVAVVYAIATNNRPLQRKLWGYLKPVLIWGGLFAVLIAILLLTR